MKGTIPIELMLDYMFSEWRDVIDYFFPDTTCEEQILIRQQCIAIKNGWAYKIMEGN